MGEPGAAQGLRDGKGPVASFPNSSGKPPDLDGVCDGIGSWSQHAWVPCQALPLSQRGHVT